MVMPEWAKPENWGWQNTSAGKCTVDVFLAEWYPDSTFFA